MDFIRNHKILIVTLAIVVIFIGAVWSQNNSSSKEISPRWIVDLSQPMTRGNENATVSLIQYSDFLCPSCSYVSTKAMPEITKNYIDTGKVKFEFRPMAFIAEGSTQAGMGAYCAVDQNKFWEYHDAIYEFVYKKVFSEGLDPKSDIILTSTKVKTIAKNVGLEEQSFSSCLDSEKYLDNISSATDAAHNDGVMGTPYIAVNGTRLNGNPTTQTLESLIKTKL